MLGLQLISACVFGLESAKMIGLPPLPLTAWLGCGLGLGLGATAPTSTSGLKYSMIALVGVA